MVFYVNDAKVASRHRIIADVFLRRLLDGDLIVVDHEDEDILNGAVVVGTGGDVGVGACPRIAGGAHYIVPLNELALGGHEADAERALAAIGRVAIDEQAELAVGQQMTAREIEAAVAGAVVDGFRHHRRRLRVNV